MTKESKHPRHRRGARATQLVLEAALEFAARNGLDATTIEALAGSLHVGKTTMYRRWPNASALMIDALLSEITSLAPIQGRASVRETFLAAMMSLVELYNGHRGELIRSLIGRAQGDASLIAQLSSRWVEPRRKIAREFIREGVRRNELKKDTDPDIVLDCLYGAIYHRFLMPYDNAELNRAFVERVVRTVFDGAACSTSTIHANG